MAIEIDIEKVKEKAQSIRSIVADLRGKYVITDSKVKTLGNEWEASGREWFDNTRAAISERYEKDWVNGINCYIQFIESFVGGTYEEVEKEITRAADAFK